MYKKQINILLINNRSQSIKKLLALLENYGIVEEIEFNQLKSKNFDRYDLIVLSGSSQLNVNRNLEEVREEIGLVRNSLTPIIGICFGFELICLAYGSNIEKLNEHLDEFRLINVNRAFFPDAPEVISVKESHQWGVRNVNEDLQILGTSKDAIEIIKHKSKKIYGFQFHPELFNELTQGDELFESVMQEIIK